VTVFKIKASAEPNIGGSTGLLVINEELMQKYVYGSIFYLLTGMKSHLTV